MLTGAEVVGAEVADTEAGHGCTARLPLGGSEAMLARGIRSYLAECFEI